MLPTSPNTARGLQAAGVACLLILLSLQLTLSARRESQTWDEACHIFAGYNYWTTANFGDNPEHPPLVKLLATLPLLQLPLKVPAHPGVFSKEEDFLTATQFVFSNDAEIILFRTRMAAALLTLLLGALVFAVAKEMFGSVPAFLALALLVFEPNILAHGAVVTTDVGMSCFLLATVWAFYRYVKKPTAGRLALTGLAAGLGLATKHSAILIFPILFVLAVCEVVRGRVDAEPAESNESRARQAMRLLGAIAVIGVLSVAILWSFYGFHFHPRAGVDAGARVVEYAGRLKNPVQAKMIQAAARWHLLPQSYLYGLADVGFTAEYSHSYLLGTVYPHGRWTYFPVAFAHQDDPGTAHPAGAGAVVAGAIANRGLERVAVSHRSRRGVFPGGDGIGHEHRGSPHLAGLSVSDDPCGVGSVAIDAAPAALGLCRGALAFVECGVVGADLPGLPGVCE